MLRTRNQTNGAHVWIARFALQRARQVRDGGFVIAVLMTRDASIIIEHRERLEPDGLIEIGQRLGSVLFGAVGERATVVSQRCFWICLDDFAVERNGGVVIAREERRRCLGVIRFIGVFSGPSFRARGR